jgi:phage terminase large subunit-like protein
MTPFWRNKNLSVKDAAKWKRPGARFDRDKADRAVDFIETCCRHVKGELAGQPIKLEPWQKEIVRGVFGWHRANGTRLFRECYIEVPRKNGKSTLGAAIALYMLFADGELGAEIYSVAADTDQANIVFSVARGMVEQDQELSEVAQSFRRSIVYKSSAYHVLSADAPTKHGKNASNVLFDELHAQPNRELYDVMKTSTGARRQPLFMMFTTAGFDRNSICWEVHEYAQKVIDGTVNDSAFLPVIYASEESDDWTNKRVWKAANPNFGVSIKEEYLEAECERAKSTPAYENTFRRLHLNQWTQQDVRWMPMAEWDQCNMQVSRETLRGRRCYAGLDLASTTDIAALVLVFPGEPFQVLPFFWIPEDNIRDRVVKDRVPYDAWINQGLVEATPGNRIDYRWIMLQIGKCRVEFDLKMLAFDRWGSDKIVTDLCDEVGFSLDEKEAKRNNKPILYQFGQGFASMSAPSRELLNMVLGREIAHGGNPVLRWMANNVVAKTDPAGNIKPDKGKSTEKIDGIVALVMALDLAIRNANQNDDQTFMWSLNG